MPRRKLPCNQGDWFTVPLDDGSIAVGLLARKTRGAILFGYFFGPPREQVPSLSDLRYLRPEDAILVRRFGWLGLTDGNWTVLGSMPGWSKDAWPLPDFGRIDTFAQRAWRASYDERTLGCMADREVSVEEASRLPKDVLSGARAIEITLSRLLNVAI